MTVRLLKNKLFVILSTVIVLLSLAFFSIRPTVTGMVKNMITDMAPQLLNAELSVGEVTMPHPTKIQLHDLIIKKDGLTIAEVPRLTLSIAPWNAMADNKLLMLDTISLRNPTFRLKMNEKQVWNISDLLKPQPESGNKFASLIVLTDAKVQLDMNGKQINSLLNGSVDARSANDNFMLDLDAHTDYVGGLKVVGMLNTDKQGRLTVKAAALELDALQDIFKQYVPKLTKLSGSVQNLDIIWQNEKGKKLLNGHLDNKGVRLTYNWEDDKLFNLEVNGALGFKDGEIEFKQTQVKVNDQLLRLSGGVLGKNDTWIPNNLKLTMMDADIGKLTSDERLVGKIDAEVTVSGEKEQMNAQGSLKSKSLELFGYTAQNVNIPLVLEKNKIRIKDALLNTMEGKVKLNFVMDIKTKQYNLEIDGEEIDLSKSQIADELQGSANIKLVATGKADDLSNINGAANLQLGGFAYKGLVISSLSLDVAKTGKNISIQNGGAKLENGGSIAFMGSIDDGNTDVFFTSGHFPLEFIGHMAGVDSNGTADINMYLKGNLDNPDVKLSISSAGGRVAGQDFEGLRSELRWQNKILTIDKLHVLTAPIMDTLSGEYQVTGQVDLRTAIPNLALKVTADTIRIDGPAKNLAELELTGYFSTDTIVQGPLNDLNISGTSRIDQGSVHGIAFKFLRSSYTYRNGLLAISDLTMRGLTEAQLTAVGTMSPNGELDIDLVANNLNLALITPDKNPEAKGNIFFDGKVRGHYLRPQFAGALSSQQIILHGQAFTNLKGEIYSDAGRVTRANLSFKEGAGTFDFEGLLDYPNSFVAGKLVTQNADIKPLLALADYHPDVNGLLDGEVYLNRRGKGSGLEIKGEIKQGRIAGVPLQLAVVDLFMDRSIVRINKFVAAQGAGYLVAKGRAFVSGDVDMTIDGKALNAKMLSVLTGPETPMGGLMDFTAKISGEMRNPKVALDMFIDGGNYAGVGFDGFAAKVDIDTADRITVKEMSLTRDNFKTTLDGFIPFDVFKKVAERNNPNAQMNLHLHLNKAELGVFAANKYIDDIQGQISGDINFAGTLEQPTAYGQIKIDNATLRPATFKKPITGLNLSLVADGQNLILEDLSAKSGRGDLAVSGRIAMNGTTVQEYNLKGLARNFDLDSQYIKGVLNGSFSLKPHVTPRRTRPILTAVADLENISFNIPKIPEFGDTPPPDLSLDVQLNLGKNVKFFNKMFFDVDVVGNIHMLGSAKYPVINGNLRVEQGRIDYLRTGFKVREAYIAWPTQGTFLPTVRFDAITRLLQTDINLVASGPVNQMNIVLSSDPPHTQQELFRMLTLKTESNSSQVGGADAQALLISGLQMSVLGDVEYEITKRLGLAEFRIYQGELYTGTSVEMVRKKVVRGNNEKTQYNLLISKYLTDRWLLGYTFSNDFNYSLLYTQYNIGKNFNISAAMDEQRKMRYALEYKITF